MFLHYNNYFVASNKTEDYLTSIPILMSAYDLRPDQCIDELATTYSFQKTLITPRPNFWEGLNLFYKQNKYY